MEALSFERLVGLVDQMVTGDDPLDRVDAAVTVAGSLSGQADSLVDLAVARARAAGRSWTEIGARLGVSKQAARKRFTDGGPAPVLPPEVSLRPRLRSCLSRAEYLAQAAGAAQVGAEHLLAGLLTDGVGALILDKLGVTADAVASSTARLFGLAHAPADTVPPLSADAVCAIEAAAQRAQVRAEHPGDVTVGTEHLLAVLALDHGSRAHRVLVDLGIDLGAVKKELACYVTLGPPPRPRRLHRARRAADSCSFCGTAESPSRPLAHGPGVTICTVCAQRAIQAIAARAAA
jgi:Clp amino terminal domain, pathogenicity island component/ClpX C4-type zinc finger